MSISLSKEDRQLVVRVDMDEAASAIEKLWTLVNSMAKLGMPEPAKVAHNALLLTIAEAIAMQVSASSAEMNAATEDGEQKVVH